MLITLLIFILSSTDNRAKISITTNNSLLQSILSQTTDNHFLQNQRLDQMQWPLLQCTAKSIIGDRELNIFFDKGIKIENPNTPFLLNLTPHNFLHNRYTPLLNSIPTQQLLKTTLKQIHKITNLLRWQNQHRISLWKNRLPDIDWDATLSTLSYNDKPKALYTDPNRSNLKNFKVKLIAKELLTFLLLHFRNPIKYPNYLCPRCYSAPEDYAHLLTCISNPFFFKIELTRILNRIADKEEQPLNNPHLFVQSYYDLHITQQVPIGLITERTMAPFTTEHLKKKITPQLHITSLNSYTKKYGSRLEYHDIQTSCPYHQPSQYCNSKKHLLSPNYNSEQL